MHNNEKIKNLFENIDPMHKGGDQESLGEAPKDAAYKIHAQGLSYDEKHLVDLFMSCCKKYPEQVACSFMGTEITYHKLAVYSYKLAKILQAQHTKKHVRVGVMLPNCLHFPVCFWSVMRAGYTAVLINPMLTQHELALQLEDAQLDALIFMDISSRVVRRAVKKAPVKHLYICSLGDFFGHMKRNILQIYLKFFKRKVPIFRLKNTTVLRNSLLACDDFEDQHVYAELASMSPDDLALIQYTGGTTGRAKGVMLSHENLIANATQCEDAIRQMLPEGPQVVLAALPLYHVYALMICAICFMRRGSELVLVLDPRQQSKLIHLLAESKLTVFVGINTLFQKLLLNKKFSEVDCSSWKLSISGGMSLQDQINLQWRQRTGTPMVQGYGLTEASPVVSINLSQHKKHLHSIGQAIPATDVAVIDTATQELCALNQPGELCVRGPQVMQGYLNLPDKTQHCLINGWLLTGDIVYMDKDGYLYVVDRKKDMVVISGFNVYPAEIELILEQHPAVIEAAVIGVQAADDTESLQAFVVCNDKAITAQDIVSHCQEHLVAYKVPKNICFKRELPKSHVGKVLRRELVAKS